MLLFKDKEEWVMDFDGRFELLGGMLYADGNCINIVCTKLIANNHIRK